MRKRIGVFIGEVNGEYQRLTLQSIFRRAGELDYDVFAFCNFGAYGDDVLYAEGEKEMIRLSDLSVLDGIIVEEDILGIKGMGAALEKYLKAHAKCPVVYLRTPKDSFFNVRIENVKIMEDITRHFVVDHGFRDICFMMGKKEYVDAQERYRGFLNVMEEAGIPVTKRMVFEGDYWREKGKEAVDWFMEGRTSYPQAIICSNDYMAISICDELRKRGVRIPEEVCVSGFDNLEEARLYKPSLTSAGVSPDEIAVKAVEMIDRVCRGEEQERIEYIKPRLVLRKSCGCGEQERQDNWSELHDQIYNQEKNVKQIIFMTTDCQAAFEEEDYLRVAGKYIYNIEFDKAYLCLCDNEQELEDGACCFTENMVLKRRYTKERETVKMEKKFPRKEILPPEIVEDAKPQAFLIFSIHYKHMVYGYMAFTFSQRRWPDPFVQAYLMCLANAIEDGAMHRNLTNLEEIKAVYLSDPVTGIYNRCGYEKALRQLYERTCKDGRYMSIASIDMDGLKYINDSFGHAEGDEVLRHLAGVMKGLAEKDEIYARIGGDEFSMILVSDGDERHKEFEEKFIQAMAMEEKRLNKPYPFHASIGICCICEEEGVSLMECMELADKRMYEQKRKNKMTREDFNK